MGGTPMTLPTILIVDDNEDARLLLKTIFHRQDQFVIVEATNGQDVLDLVQQILPNLILMDLMMPVLDGWEATRRMRALDSPVRTVPIIAVTAYGSDDAREKALAAGCTNYL